jgi:two-component system invasion response regulator UvrY
MIRILIADDHFIVRQGLKQVISDTPDLQIENEACDGQEVLSYIRKNDYDIVILDISMPGRNGIEVLKEIKTIKPNIEVLILSMHPEEQFAIRALRAGAAGYLTKKSISQEIVSAIRTISSGRKYVSPSVAQTLAFEIEEDTQKAPHETLSDREYQVMCLIASGKAVSEIADELALSVQSISTYRSRLLEKMKLRNNAEITHYAIKNGLVD